MGEKARILTGEEMARAVKRIGHEIVERSGGSPLITLIGIQRRGVVLAKRLAECLRGIDGTSVETGVLDITFYRDDLSLLSSHPVVNGTYIGFAIDGKRLILVDDVVYTGRTTRAAMDALMDLGRPSRIEFMALIDRGNRELPIQPDYVGRTVPTSKDEYVSVKVAEIDGEDSVTIGDLRVRQAP
ncbi:MAG: bifunctional pyr operon transcriptional regulator/uracil phosphoribosyltransferase PyrR [Oscillospiraceae bacterium]|nr:bifunctional pyr operon transcriptional regulator/uracil phosphoribosyltransferase PyrR [Oscillospiraceae bacterium]